MVAVTEASSSAGSEVETVVMGTTAVGTVTMGRAMVVGRAEQTSQTAATAALLMASLCNLADLQHRQSQASS